MSVNAISLEDRFDLSASPVVLTGAQALVRLMLMQAARDRAAGHDTAGYVTGYRGSPLGGVDMQFQRAGEALRAAGVRFQPGLNEDLAATALWGTQQAGLRGEGRHDGVFGLWYAKGPGVDRSGDVLRHANMAGTAPLGGVLAVMGDDHTGESSTTLHQSDWGMIDCYVPVLSPAGVQEVLDYGLIGFALSRFSGLWVGLKAVKDTIEATAVVDGRPDRVRCVTPDISLPEGGLNIRLGDDRVAQEARIIDHKRRAAEAFARANRLDRRVWGRRGAKIGLVAAGKNWLDLMQALSLLGLDRPEAERLGITTYKVAMTWPLDMASFHDWAEGLDLIVVVEEKRKLIEVQVKEAIFDDRRGRRVWGWHRGTGGAELFPTRYALDPALIAERLGEVLVGEGRGGEALRARLDEVRSARRAAEAPAIAQRLPYFCAGCPHNSSTVLPEGARAYAGIGCHYMVQWMDRATLGFTQMGGEGANWIGEAPFSTRDHVFQNMGDGTYNHSGAQAIRAALAAGVNITFKILYNDAVAMTGGQANDGELSPQRIAAELVAMGVREVAVVHDEKEPVAPASLPREVSLHPRAKLDAVQRRLAGVAGVTALIYVQTCAAEKRRRRKRGSFPRPDKRVFINPDVCEGCGDCGVQSNCVAIQPKETPLGTKREIDQSACNADYSCLKGFCPSFVTLEGATPRSAPAVAVDTGDLPAPDLPAIEGTHAILLTGIGGTGVVTIGAILTQAAAAEGKGAAMIEMAGLAQKGGAVQVHCRIAGRPEDISAVRVAAGEADCVIGGDLVVTATPALRALMRTGRTGAVINTHETPTGDFTRDAEFRLPGNALRRDLEATLDEGATSFDATALARRALGDAVFANMILLGAAWQRGLVPLSAEAIAAAIRANGAAVEANLRAFEIGRWAIHRPREAARLSADEAPPEETPGAEIARLEAHLVSYQGRRLLARFRRHLAPVSDPDLRLVAARAYHKLLARKDEYEVARLLLRTGAQARAAFEGDFRMTFHLAPPILGGRGPDGRPRKRAFGPWLMPVLRALARLKALRGTPLDPFGWLPERRAERRLLRLYEQDLGRLAAAEADGVAMSRLHDLAGWPMAVRGFGPVKMAAIERALAARRGHLARLEPGAPEAAAA